jgi:hypothetical protein
MMQAGVSIKETQILSVDLCLYGMPHLQFHIEWQVGR